MWRFVVVLVCFYGCVMRAVIVSCVASACALCSSGYFCHDAGASLGFNGLGHTVFEGFIGTDIEKVPGFGSAFVFRSSEYQ